MPDITVADMKMYQLFPGQLPFWVPERMEGGGVGDGGVLLEGRPV